MTITKIIIIKIRTIITVAKLILIMTVVTVLIITIIILIITTIIVIAKSYTKLKSCDTANGNKNNIQN